MEVNFRILLESKMSETRLYCFSNNKDIVSTSMAMQNWAKDSLSMRGLERITCNT